MRCCTATYFNGRSRYSHFPRPRFTLKTLLVTVALFGVANSTINCAARNRLIGQGDEVSRRSESAAIALNCSLAIAVFYIFSTAWLRKVVAHARTQGEIPMSRGRPPLWREDLSWFSMPWMGISLSVTNWLGAGLAPGQQLKPVLFVVTSAFVFFFIAAILVRTPATRPLWLPFSESWKIAGTAERIGGVLASSWPVGVVLFTPFLAKRVLPALSYSLIIPALLLLVLGWRLAFHVGEALWTRLITAGHLNSGQSK